MRAEDWTPAMESLCINRYLKFWAEVKAQFAALPAGVTAPRVLIFFEFKHSYTSDADIKAFRSKLLAALVKYPSGDGLIRQMLPEHGRAENGLS